MAFMSKEDLAKYAEKFGIDIGELSWAEAQKAVQAAMNEAGVPAPEKKLTVKKRKKPPLPRHRKKLIAPGIKPTPYQFMKYDEDLGPELAVEEKSFDLGDFRVPGARDTMTGTYSVKGKTGRRVTAQSTLPQVNIKIEYDPEIDVVPVGEWNSKRGYIYDHPTLPCVKGLLERSGYWYEYRDRFVAVGPNSNNVWYAAGKMELCDIGLVNGIVQEINRREKAKHNG